MKITKDEDSQLSYTIDALLQVHNLLEGVSKLLADFESDGAHMTNVDFAALGIQMLDEHDAVEAALSISRKKLKAKANLLDDLTTHATVKDGEQ